MTKRELIEKNKVKKLLDEGWDRGVYPRNDIMCLPTLTEQEIVKPYLKKLRAKINEEIDFEEKWLNDVFCEDKGITLRDIEIAMNGIRHVVKGELEE